MIVEGGVRCDIALSTKKWLQFSSVQSLSHVRLFATPWTSVKYCSAIKKNKIVAFAATWMDLEVIIAK